MFHFLHQICPIGHISWTFAFGFVFLTLLYWFSINNHDYFKKRGMPYVRPIPFIGSIFETLQRPLHEIDVLRHKSLGPVYGYFEGKVPVICIADPKLLRDVLVKDFEFFPGRRAFHTGNPILDLMFPLMQGKDWKRIRDIVSPFFNSVRMKKMMKIFNDCSSTVVETFHEEISKGNCFEVKSIYCAYAMDIITSSVFSVKIDSYNNPDNPLVSSARKLMTGHYGWRYLLYTNLPWLARLLKIPVSHRQNPERMKFFIDFTLKIIEERQKSGQKGEDFLEMLLDATDVLNMQNSAENVISTKKMLSMDELAAQCVVFFVTGSDPSASTLALCTYLLALHQNVQDKARSEVDTLLKEYQGQMTYEAVQRMQYLENVISETLRLYPAGVRLDRVAAADYRLGDTGFIIPKGMKVIVPCFALHRDPQHYPHPDKFDPDRFNAEEKSKRDNYAYLPLGAGPRNCVGSKLALLEIKVCMAHILAHFKVRTSSSTKVPVEFNISPGVLQPRDIIVEMESRPISIMANSQQALD